MTGRADVAVIGAGVAGLATAAALARAGADVVVLEQHRIGHPDGSSHGSARIFRLSYTDPAFVRMGLDAVAAWSALEDDAGEHLLHHVPALSVGPGVPALAEAMGAGGAPYEMLTGAAAGERFPSMRFAAGETVLLEPGAAVIAAERALRALAAVARAAGARIVEEACVLRVTDRDGGVELASDTGSLRARVAVVTAGPWAKGLLAPAGIDLPVRGTRETVAFFPNDGGGTPILLDWTEPVRYALPTPEGLLKAGEHVAGPEADPDGSAPPDADAVARVGAWLNGRVATAGLRATSAETCPYTMTADARFLIERHGSIVVGSACSGHGFKFAPLVGARLAGLALTA